MTCNDENLVPLTVLPLHGILRFRPPPVDLAVDYLLSLAGAEGHVLRRAAIEALYESRSRDLRGSIADLDLCCQMAIGDRKGGLDWLQPWSYSSRGNVADVEGLHVVSKDAYVTGLGWASRDAAIDESSDTNEKEEHLLMQAWSGWEADVEDWCEDAEMRQWANDCSQSQIQRGVVIAAYDDFFDALSAADVFAGDALATGFKVRLLPDSSLSTNSPSAEIVQGYSYLDVKPALELDELSMRLALAARVLSKQRLLKIGIPTQMLDAPDPTPTRTPTPSSIDLRTFNTLVLRYTSPKTSNPGITRHDFSAAFDPLSEPVAATAPSVGSMQYSEFDRTLAVLAEDLAPYVRSIVSRDEQLQAQRKRLDELLSAGGRYPKRMRTTRASRSAMEGGERGSMRRDKWFEAEVAPALVLKTGPAILSQYRLPPPAIPDTATPTSSPLT
ncbi:MAG: hypothetical protein M1826_000148 [Phylliscum demangeonii]|nr:MAG: hypothetical protein M1826_000148 [Phylliscum demangeonii]